MPGSNCAIYGCHNSGAEKGISFFGIPTKDDEYSTEWRTKILDVITRDRIVDSNLKRQIKNRTLSVCEVHYPPDKVLHRESY